MQEPFYLLGLPGEDVHSRRVIGREAIERCFVTTLFFTESDRFAWGRWQREHSPLTSFHLTLTGAQRQAEHLRAPGASWVIREIPALVLQGRERGVVLTELGEPTPFKRLSNMRPEGPRLLPLADQFVAQVDPDKLVRLVVPAGVARPVTGPFRTYQSVVGRPGEALGWKRAPTPNRRPHAVHRLVEGITSALGLPQDDQVATLDH